MNIVQLLKARFQRKDVDRNAKVLLSYLNDVKALQAHVARMAGDAASAKVRAQEALRSILTATDERPQSLQAPVSIVQSQDSDRGISLTLRVLSHEEGLFVHSRIRELSRTGALPKLGLHEGDWVKVIVAEILVARKLSLDVQDTSTRTIREGGQA